MNRVPARQFSQARKLPLLVGAALGITFAGCSGGDDTVGTIKTGGDFVVLSTVPSNNGQLFLNDSIQIDFSNAVNLDSANLSTFSFLVRDQIGNVVNEPVPGTFALARSPSDSVVGRRLSFVPRLPTNDAFTDGSFRPGRVYEVNLVGGDRVTGTVLRDAAGKGLKDPVSFRFSTSDGTTPTQLFRNTAAGGPRRTGFLVSPTPDSIGTAAPDGPGAVLNKLGAPGIEVRLLFDQPLNPSSVNVPVNVDINPLTRNESTRGNIYLEYTDPELGPNVWIPAEIDLESNSVLGATVLVRPIGILPNNATIRVIVLNSLEDISGESNLNNASYVPEFGTFRTKRTYEQQFDGIIEDFLATSQVDFTAPFSEPFAEAGPGYIKAGFAFEGTPTSLEFDPSPVETVLNTNFTLVTPKDGAPYNVQGGVFNFKNVTIQAGRTVRGQGSNPMVWLVSGKVEVAGTLTVRGGDGELADTSGGANVPRQGGAGVCGGGDGGDGSPSTTARDEFGGARGNGPMQVPLQGGLGGSLACSVSCVRGSGGGGGGMATQGDPNYKQKLVPAGTLAPPNAEPIFTQQVGNGGPGCGQTGTAGGAAGSALRVLAGGTPGPSVFTDSRLDNNYWGSAIDRRLNLRITGELSLPIGGGGGGGGGDLSYNNNCNSDDVTFENDSRGGGGGGGGGVLIVKALGPIIIQNTGTISADGGHGGGGEVSGSSSKGGGGGGGAGGMVVLMSATRIEINARGHGSGASAVYTYQGNNYDFSVSADGGVCRTGLFGTPIVQKKYPANGVAVPAGSVYDAAPLGGLGGMGVVQLMVPPGTVPAPGTDGTNTNLDDNIVLKQAGVTVNGATKQALLAWRGFPDQIGQGRDDDGDAINIGDNEGDIRPSPVLLPVPFAAKSRLRSQWIDTGSSVRRSLATDDDSPRAFLATSGAIPGPTYEFSGLAATGYAEYVVQASLGKVVFPAIGAATAILTKNANSTFLGQPAYRVELVTTALGDVADRYSQYEAELLNATNAVVGSFRILSHTSRSLVLSPESGSLPDSATKVQVRAKFFKVVTNGVEGLGSTYIGSTGDRVPNSNVRIGFAFHRKPAAGTGRFPTDPQAFVSDIGGLATDPAFQAYVAANGNPAFVQWDILFDGEFRVDLDDDVPPPFGPSTPRPELHFLRVPFRF